MFAAGVALVVLLGGAQATAPPAEAAPVRAAERAERAAREVIDRRFQRQLPLAPPGGEARAPDGRPRQAPGKARSAPERRRDRERAREEAGAGGVVGAAMRSILLGVLAIAVVMLLVWLVRDLRRGEPDALAGDEVPEPTVDAGVVERPVGDADELARAGRHAEAIHTLLLRTLSELVRATRTRVPASLTSREILARVPLVPPARAALDALVTAVEVSYFGDDVPGAADYERCRAEFQRFADAYRGAA